MFTIIKWIVFVSIVGWAANFVYKRVDRVFDVKGTANNVVVVVKAGVRAPEGDGNGPPPGALPGATEWPRRNK